MRHVRNILAVIAVACVSAQTAPSRAADAARGAELARQWCAGCHLVADDQASATTEAPPFAAIARRSPDELAALAGFLADPHPPMPDLSLTREEIRDLLAYIATLK
jgi:mono/diheme cytochrome c family protein